MIESVVVQYVSDPYFGLVQHIFWRLTIGFWISLFACLIQADIVVSQSFFHYAFPCIIPALNYNWFFTVV